MLKSAAGAMHSCGVSDAGLRRAWLTKANGQYHITITVGMKFDPLVAPV